MGDEGAWKAWLLTGILSASFLCLCRRRSEKKLGEFRGEERDKERRTEHSVTQIGRVFWGSPNPSFTT